MWGVDSAGDKAAGRHDRAGGGAEPSKAEREVLVRADGR